MKETFNTNCIDWNEDDGIVTDNNCFTKLYKKSHINDLIFKLNQTLVVYSEKGITDEYIEKWNKESSEKGFNDYKNSRKK